MPKWKPAATRPATAEERQEFGSMLGRWNQMDSSRAVRAFTMHAHWELWSYVKDNPESLRVRV